MSIVMERNPDAFRTLNEPDIRQHFLVQLNGFFKGMATGETFNYKGKTDILLRYQGKNLFIAECKFWKSPKTVTDTINQILKYVNWRDSKAAILFFNRDQKISKLIKDIPDLVRSHSGYKKDLEFNSGYNGGFRYLFHHLGDENSLLYLTILIFNIPSKNLT
ncbi:MAG: hypothetical protein HeimC3_16550 [Candidatus Heimdallarchaeota archaeon LC_3]|nr:MAG: hypothetical protein HeimC3_16550 [Candidatus Heimdallarchaeota archaeon LC_3]